jgi:hypothetical protein
LEKITAMSSTLSLSKRRTTLEKIEIGSVVSISTCQLFG